jgi:hypothetical protein
MGTFTTIIDIISIMAIIVNSSLIAFTSNTLLYYFPYMNEWDRVFYAVACEHLLVRKTRKCCMRTFMRISAQTQMHLAHCDTHTHTTHTRTHKCMQTHTGKLVQLFLKVFMDMWVDVPADVELAYKKKKYEESVMREKFDDKDPEEVCTQP